MLFQTFGVDAFVGVVEQIGGGRGDDVVVAVPADSRGHRIPGRPVNIRSAGGQQSPRGRHVPAEAGPVQRRAARVAAGEVLRLVERRSARQQLGHPRRVPNLRRGPDVQLGVELADLRLHDLDAVVLHRRVRGSEVAAPDVGLDRAELDEAVNEDRRVRAVQVLRPKLGRVPPGVPPIANADQLPLTLGEQAAGARRGLGGGPGPPRWQQAGVVREPQLHGGQQAAHRPGDAAAAARTTPLPALVLGRAAAPAQQHAHGAGGGLGARPGRQRSPSALATARGATHGDHLPAVGGPGRPGSTH